MTPDRPRRPLGRLALLLVVALTGCESGAVDTRYGGSRDASVNGTRAFLERLKAKGHPVKTTYRLNEQLESDADVIVRFADKPGPPPSDEAEWYIDWLSASDNRRLVYVARDFDAEGEFWASVAAQLPKDASEPYRKQIESRKAHAETWPLQLPPDPKKAGNPEDWFAVEPRSSELTTAKRLEGPWAAGVDAGAAAIPVHRALKVNSETVLLRGDGKPLVISWERFKNGRVLVVGNGSFLLNGALLNKARRPLAERVADWIGEPSRRVVFVDGGSVTSGEGGEPTLFALLGVPPFGWIIAQLVLLGVIACLARAPRLGRPRDADDANVERPLAHPEALGALLARTRRREQAESLLEAYRKWRAASRSG